MGNLRVHVVVPVFRETALVAPFLKSWEGVDGFDVTVYVVNGDPGDDVSDLLEAWPPGKLRVRELEGSPALYWSGLVGLGLRRVAEACSAEDIFVLSNIDVRFEGNPVRTALEGVGDIEGKQVVLPVVGSQGKVLSAGVQVRSWALSSNRHVYDGTPAEELPEATSIPATYLPTRFFLCSARALLDGVFPDEARLPHYCADYEYTNRLRTRGFEPVIYTGATVSISEENTGFDTYLKRTSLWARLKRVADIKCPYNFRYRYRFVRLTYPPASQVPGMITHFAKILLEIAVGGRHLEGWRRR